MNNPRWRPYIIRLLIGVAAIALLAWATGYTLLIPGLALSGYLAWHIYNSLRFLRWLQAPQSDPPASGGLWADIFSQASQRSRQHLEAQNRAKALAEDFQAMADALPDAMLVIDRNDTITWFNQSAMVLLGISSGVNKSLSVTELIDDPEFSSWFSIQEKLNSTLDVTSPIDSAVSLQISAIDIRNEQRLLLIRNITELANLNRMRHDLVANVSHELRTPLTVLLGYLEVLKSGQGKSTNKVIKRMLKQAQQMHNLVEDLLELSRLQDTGRHSGIDVVDVPGVLLNLQEQAEELSQGSHTIQFSVQSGIRLHGDKSDIESAFQNLIVNAINYTPEGGQIHVSWKDTTDGPLFSVRDNGVGIPEEDIPRIVERFYRVGDDRNRKTGGTGLGLAIVKHVLSSHDAVLDVTSELGTGSEFSCRFPPERKA